MPGAHDLLRLNFHSFDKIWIQNYCYSLLRESKTLTDWKKEILYFIIDWLSHSEEIKATTSGSTGVPKTIALKKQYVKTSAESTVNYFNFKEGDKLLLCLPVKYIAGKLMIVRALEGKMNLYCVQPSLTPEIEDVNFDFAAMTPAQVSSLLENDKGIELLNRIKTLIIGGDKISVSLEDKLQSLETAVFHTYGMTETITHIALRKVNGNDRSEWFFPLPGVELSLSDDQCLIIDAPHLGVRFMKTNDIAELNDEGAFKVKGRKDNVVISGGVKLFPEEIEKKIEKLVDKPFYFTGVQDERFGSRLVMVIESKEPVDKTILLQSLKPYLSKYELPKEIIVKESLVRTGSGKVKR